MEIKITRQSNSILLDQNKALWKFKQGNKPWTSTAFPILSLFLGVMMVVISFIYCKLGEPFWKRESIFGIALITLSLSIYIYYFVSKTNLILSTKKIIKEYEKQNNVTEIILTETLIRLRDFQSYHEFKWSVFKNINVSKGHFFFMSDMHYKNGFIISKTELTEKDIQELTDFIRGNRALS